MAAPCLYLDVDDQGLRARLDSGRPVALSFPPDPERDDGTRLSFEERITAALAALKEEMDLTGCRAAALFLPGRWISFRHLSLPFTGDRKIRQILPMTLAPALPAPDQPRLYDFIPLNQRFEPGRHLILAAALPEAPLKAIFSALSQMGIRPVLAAPGGLSRAMACAGENPDTPAFVHAHIAEQEICLTLVVDHQPLAVSVLPPGSRDGQGPARLAAQIRRLVTGAALRAGLDDAALAGIPVMAEAQAQDALDAAMPGLEQAFGTVHAVQERPLSPDTAPPLDFCRGPYRAETVFSRYRIPLALTAALAVLAVGLHFFSLARQNSRLETELARVRQEILTVYSRNFPGTDQGRVRAPLLLMASKVKQARETAAEQGDDLPAAAGPKVMDLLHELSARIPTGIDMTLTRLVLNRGRLVLTGTTGNFNDVDKIQGLIRACPGFRQVSISSAEADKTQAGKAGTENQVRFKFIVEL